MSQNIPEAVVHFLVEEGFGEITSVEPLTGGVANLTRRITTTAHISFVLKQNAERWENLFSCEAAGLAALREAGMRTPHVWAVDNDFLLLEDLGNRCPSESSWKAFGRALAILDRRNRKPNNQYN
ncbi:MAG: fructosamine kinase family protein, partial [Anaerolineae bacterium]|nr:fructosamine kinase family protein [Anaerolineae bacterium]